MSAAESLSRVCVRAASAYLRRHAPGLMLSQAEAARLADLIGEHAAQAIPAAMKDLTEALDAGKPADRTLTAALARAGIHAAQEFLKSRRL